MYMAQTYPQELMEWIIFDDGQEDTEHLFLDADLTNVRYIKKASKLSMGMKLNMLKNAAVGDITVVMDDDDYYPRLSVYPLSSVPSKKILRSILPAAASSIRTSLTQMRSAL